MHPLVIYFNRKPNYFRIEYKIISTTRRIIQFHMKIPHFNTFLQNITGFSFFLIVAAAPLSSRRDREEKKNSLKPC